MDQEIVLDPVQSDEGLVINCLQDYRCDGFPRFEEVLARKPACKEIHFPLLSVLRAAAAAGCPQLDAGSCCCCARSCCYCHAPAAQLFSDANTYQKQDRHPMHINLPNPASLGHLFPLAEACCYVN